MSGDLSCSCSFCCRSWFSSVSSKACFLSLAFSSTMDWFCWKSCKFNLSMREASFSIFLFDLLLNASHALAALGAKEYKIGRLLIRCLMQNERRWRNCPNTTCSRPNQSLCSGLRRLELETLRALSNGILNGRTKPLINPRPPQYFLKFQVPRNWAAEMRNGNCRRVYIRWMRVGVQPHHCVILVLPLLLASGNWHLKVSRVFLNINYNTDFHVGKSISGMMMWKDSQSLHKWQQKEWKLMMMKKNINMNECEMHGPPIITSTTYSCNYIINSIQSSLNLWMPCIPVGRGPAYAMNTVRHGITFDFLLVRYLAVF